MDPLKYLFEKPALSGRLSRCLILLAEFDLKYMARKIIKGSAITNFCAENPMEGEGSKEDFLDESILNIKLGARKMYFDGVMTQYGNGIGILLIIPYKSHIPVVVKLNFEAINNMEEYQACIVGMEALQELRAKEAEVYGDSTLVIAQAQKLWKVKEEHLNPYQKYLKELTRTFDIRLSTLSSLELKINLQMC